MTLKDMIHRVNKFFTTAVGVILLVVGIVFLSKGVFLDDTLMVRGVVALIGIFFSGCGIIYLIKVRK